MSLSDTVTTCLQALYDAADDDSATGGPGREPAGSTRSWPAITADGFRRLPDEETATYARAVVDERMRLPDGPTAPLREAG